MSALVDGLTAINNAVAETTDERAPLIAAKCRALLAGYDFRWAQVPFVVESVEQTVIADLTNPSTGKTSRNFRLAGKIDAIGSRDNRRIIVDHKTTSDDIEDPNGAYWRQLVVESQPTMYMILELSHGREVDYAMWDVVRKPSISPKKLTKAERASIVSDRRYFNRPVTQDDLDAMQVSERETLHLYENRLAHDCIEERPNRYFARRPVQRLDHEIVEFAEELWQHGQDILHSRRECKSRGTLPPRNSGACMLYGSPCKFLGICSNYDEPTSDRWQKKQFAHPELGDTGEESLLTNSRVRTWQTCRRKHYYDQEERIERYDEEEREALLFGTIWHLGLNAWWSSFIPAHAR